MERNHYMVRIGQWQDTVWKYAMKGVVAVGWSDIDLSQMASDDAAKAIEKLPFYADSAPQVVGKKKNEVWRFKYIKKGDIIVVPYRSNILLAESEGEFLYSADDLGDDLANQLKVRYQYINDEPRILPRAELSEGLSRRLRVRGSTISDLYEFADEIERIYGDVSYSSIERTTADRNSNLEKDFMEKLISDIRNGHTYLKTGGEGLEDLVKKLFEAEGYFARIPSKQTYSGHGDADIVAEKRDFVSEIKILAQVKHHNWNTDDWGIQQLDIIKESGEYAGYKFILITSGDVNADVRHLASDKDIDIMDGDKLAEWVLSCLPKLPKEVRARLNISDVPMFLNTEA